MTAEQVALYYELDCVDIESHALDIMYILTCTDESRKIIISHIEKMDPNSENPITWSSNHG